MESLLDICTQLGALGGLAYVLAVALLRGRS
jgi:hypothetical protein